MSTLSQFAGGSATKAIINAYSSGGVQSATTIQATVLGNAREVLSGALTANTLKTVLSVTQGGQCPSLTAYTKDATSRTVRLVVKVDGATVFDSTSSAIAASNRGIVAAGAASWDSGYFQNYGPPIRWNNTLEVQVASSLTETDKVAIAYALC